MWCWTLASLIMFLFHCTGYGQKLDAFYQYSQLYEGSRCILANGRGEGVCVKTINCPARIRQIFRGHLSAAGRCGFDKFDEIFCCAAIRTPIPRSNEPVYRPAEAACRRHKYLFRKLRGDGYIHFSVINGVLARRGEFPHMAALGYLLADEESPSGSLMYVCGGTLISKRHVVTAAHCVNNIQGLVPVEVVLGANDLGVTEFPGRQGIPISRITKHPEHKRSLNYHDVAILELQNPAKFTIDVFPTCLMTKPLSRETVNARTSLVVLGWGAVDLDGTTSMKLLKAERLKMVNKKSCLKSYKHVFAHIPDGLDDSMICVKDTDTIRRADTCWGDSGGPLLISSPRFPRLIGVTSFGQACGGSTPGVYASVYEYLDWIEGQVWPDSN